MALSATALEYANSAAFCGPLEGATHSGLSGIPGDGPFMRIELKVENGRISRAAYQSYGCPTSRACGALACKLLTGRTLDQAALIAANDLVVILGGVPEGKEHCPKMTAEAIQRAISATQKEQE